MVPRSNGKSLLLQVAFPFLVSLTVSILFLERMGSFMSKGRKYQFPKTLKGFKYDFNEDGQLRHTETGHQFEFMVKDNDQQYNQRRYEALGKIIDEYIYEQLETASHLKRIEIPVDPSEDEPTGFFFASDDALTNEEKLMVIMHGSGVVRAGQWSRRLIINDRLESGSQLPYIKTAIEMGYAVIVTNTNLNYEDDDKSKRRIRGSASPEEHMLYVWDNFMKKCPAKSIDVIAHSYGGVVTVNWLNTDPDARKRVHRVAFTDSVHSMYNQGATQDTADWFIQNSINWVSTFAVLNVYQGQVRNDVHKLSAGTDVHELTSYSAFRSVIRFLSGTENALEFLNTDALGLEEGTTFSKNEEPNKEDEGDRDEREEKGEGTQEEGQRLQAGQGPASSAGQTDLGMEIDKESLPQEENREDVSQAIAAEAETKEEQNNAEATAEERLVEVVPKVKEHDDQEEKEPTAQSSLETEPEKEEEQKQEQRKLTEEYKQETDDHPTEAENEPETGKDQQPDQEKQTEEDKRETNDQAIEAESGDCA